MCMWVKVMIEQGRTQVWLAEKLQVNPVTVNHWWNNRRPMPDKIKPEIAQLLGYLVSILFPDDKTKI